MKTSLSYSELSLNMHMIDKVYFRFLMLNNMTEWNNTLPSNLSAIKWIVHIKMKILSSFNHPQVVPNLYEFLSSAEHTGTYLEECQ